MVYFLLGVIVIIAIAMSIIVFKVKEIEKEKTKTTFVKKQNIGSINGYGNITKPKKKIDYKKNIERGKKFEEKVLKYYSELGYEVKENGKKRFQDKGIDIIATIHNKTTLIQCKDWETYKFGEKNFKEFIGSCEAYVNTNNLNKENMKYIFVASKNNITKQGMKFIIENRHLFEFKVIN
ncbi:MAG: Unknown protein [uncultured Campylobacterales bacterium]|uniref:Restriction endonuclease type IV Mrr domain-containing protein n=1 Tax=uncultured Campylobacterales bacterium TaxID=352960 RepID=A0A6S6SH24_9BACT|nr:MAG: Unknown protein [uncultured Campylobacterales bacterium]